MFDKNEFAKILKNINETYDSQRDFAKKSEINRTYLSQYMNMKLNEPPKPKTLEKIAKSSHGITNYRELMNVCGYIPDLKPNSANVVYNDIEKNREYGNNKFQYYMCPVYNHINEDQPNWEEDCIEGRFPIDPELMGIVNPEEYFFLRVNEESMNNIVKNGSFALIHKQDIVEDGEIAVVLVNDYDATLKKFTKQGDVIILEPDSNDSSFKIQVYNKTTPIKILGKYIGKMEINK